MNDDIKPYSYNEWLAKNSLVAEDAYKAYTGYLIDWYHQHKGQGKSLKNDYIQLLKDLNFLFKDEVKNRFLAEIDLDNDEEIINAIPYFASKVKELIQVYNEKRKNVKRAKLKHSLNSSFRGIETLLYEHILKSFTKKGQLVEIPFKEIADLLPQLKDVNDRFYIEIEEIYDKSNYFDASPELPANAYVNTEELLKSSAYQNFTDEQINSIIQSGFLNRAANNPLSRIFAQFIFPVIEAEDVEDQRPITYLNSINTIKANQKYLGSDLYGLTAIRLREVEKPDLIISLNVQPGNNWFYWPSGDKVYSETIIDNIYFPIPINSSNLIDNGATAGTGISDSDLIFTDKRGFIEGAWLRGPYNTEIYKNVSVNIEPNSIREFIWPYTGFELSEITNEWGGHVTNDNSIGTFYFLPAPEKEKILEKYYTTNLPADSAHPIYLNQTDFFRQGSFAAENSYESDVILKQNNNQNINSIYNETVGETEAAFLYKFTETNLPVLNGLNTYLWPLKRVDTDQENIPIKIDNKFCSPLELRFINIKKSFKGAVAGLTFDTADVIFKIDKQNGVPVEAAWLASQPIGELDIVKNSIKVYNNKAVNCQQCLEGPIQTGLSTLIQPGQFVSFIWTGDDTYLDNVVKFVEHNDGCPYKNIKTDYYTDQDFRNAVPLVQKENKWEKCNCRSVYFSPIGHKGNNLTDYDGITDFIFHDPEGLGDNFTFDSWKDSRNLKYRNSPQFAFYQLDKQIVYNKDVIGWGVGRWKTGSSSNNGRFVLRTGRRYTYYRSNFKTVNSETVPYLVINHPYESQTVNCVTPNCFDMVICVDLSVSQKYNLDVSKKIVEEIVRAKPINSQIAIVAFDLEGSILSYLEQTPDTVTLFERMATLGNRVEFYRTNIYDALELANTILTTTITQGTTVKNFKRLCADLNATLVAAQETLVLNDPQEDCDKKIVIISDGASNVFTKTGLNYAERLKGKGIKIHGIDIGMLSKYNDNLETMSSSNFYFNLEKFLTLSDGDIEDFLSFFIGSVNGCVPEVGRWNLATRSADGNWTGEHEQSPMIIRPGDYIIYLHREEISYLSPVNGTVAFTQPSINFTLDAPLEGWSYLTNTFDDNASYEVSGARPYWAEAYVDPLNDVQREGYTVDVNFDKNSMYSGGHVRWVENYLPVTQPDISKMVLTNGNFIQYKRNKTESLLLKQRVKFDRPVEGKVWCKLEFTKQFSKIEKLLQSNKLEYIVEPTYEESDLDLEGFYEFKNSRYNYFARNAFDYSQELFLINKCRDNFVVFTSGRVLQAEMPYAHLDNVNFPTVASVPLPYNFVTKTEVGEYLLPTKFGVSYFRGKGHSISLDPQSLTTLDAMSAERLFLDPTNYGPITRGLTKTNNYSPTKIDYVDNRWMIAPYGSGDYSGTVIDTVANQKFTAYQSSYEVYGQNEFGVSRQVDNTQFYTGGFPPVWNDPINYPLTYRGEVKPQDYLLRRDKLLGDVGIITSWKTDIYGNNYGLFKSREDQNRLQTEVPEDIKTDKENFQLRETEYLTYNVREQDALDFEVDL
jgi:hypothetical protein